MSQDNNQGPVEPLESTSAQTASRGALERLLGGSKNDGDQPTQAVAESTYADPIAPSAAAASNVCPNCGVELDEGVCSECGFDKSERLF